MACSTVGISLHFVRLQNFASTWNLSRKGIEETFADEVFKMVDFLQTEKEL